MKLSRKLCLAAALAVVCVLVLSLVGSPSRAPEDEQQRRELVDLRLKRIHADSTQDADAAEQAKKETAPEEDKAPEPEQKEEDAMWPEEAPDVFKVEFECTNGTFTVECHKEWAPLGVQRFYTLVREGFYDDSAFFRVVPRFVVQFGLAGDPAMTANWHEKRIKDDPVTQSNTSGMLTFATSGPNTRTTQLFINTDNNQRLDGMGFAPFGKVVDGMDVVKAINAEYAERPNQALIKAEGNAYVKKNFPNIDFIKKATLIK